MSDDNQRHISISVLSSIPSVTQVVHENFLQYTRDLCDLDMDYINVNITKIGDDGELEEDTTLEGEYADENTMKQVYRVLEDLGFNTQDSDNIVAALQSAGILFRQRR